MTIYTSTTFLLEVPTNRIVAFTAIVNAVTGEPIATYTNRDTNISLSEYEELGGGAGDSSYSPEDDEHDIQLITYVI